MDTGISALIDRIAASARAEQHYTRRQWTPEEDAYVRDNLADLGFDGVAQALGRSPQAVKVRQVRAQIPAASRRPGWYTGNQAARILCVDIHTIMMLHERGILRCDVLPGPRAILQIKRISLWVWAINPESWIYFKPRRVKDRRLRRLIELRKERWGDEWWSTGQVARYYGLASSKSVAMAIYRGQIPAKRWGNWWIKKSDALARPFYAGKGGAQFKDYWSPRADAFLLRVQGSGLTHEQIGRMMKWPTKKVAYRYKLLRMQDGE